MLQLVPAMLTRQVAAVSVGIGLLVLTAVLGAVALGCAAVAIYHHLLPVHGPAVAAWISGAVFLAAAALVAAVARARIKRSVAADAPKATGEASPDLALAIAGVLQEKLPKNAVPATLVALLGGLVVGLNPQVAQSLVESLARTSRQE